MALESGTRFLAWRVRETMAICEVDLINANRADSFWLCAGAVSCRFHTTEQHCVALFLRLEMLHSVS